MNELMIILAIVINIGVIFGTISAFFYCCHYVVTKHKVEDIWYWGVPLILGSLSVTLLVVVFSTTRIQILITALF